MRRNWKPYLAGLLTALLLCGLIGSASAAVEKVWRELEYRDIRVSLDGEVLDLRNAVGDPVEPFMFDGTNYLPVRALAEALGLNVAWDGKEVMVVLTTPEPETEAGDGTAEVPEPTQDAGPSEDVASEKPAESMPEEPAAIVKAEPQAPDTSVAPSTSSSAASTKPATSTTPSTGTKSGTSTSTKTTAPANKTVYVTKTGKHYHYSSTCNGGTYYASTLEAARARGLTPCNKCVN